MRRVRGEGCWSYPGRSPRVSWMPRHVLCSPGGGTAVVERSPLAVEKSAEAIVPAGSLVAGKGRTRSRGAGRPCSWMLVDRSQPRYGGLGGRALRVKPDGPVQSAAAIPAPGDTAPHPAEASSVGAVLSRGNLAEALRRVEQNAGAPGIDGMSTRELRPWLKDHWPEVRSSSTRVLTGRSRSGG